MNRSPWTLLYVQALLLYRQKGLAGHLPRSTGCKSNFECRSNLLERIRSVWDEAMKALKIFFSIVFLLILANNVRLISHWNESRGVYDDICYLRQAHLFQRFGWHGLDTNLVDDDDRYLAGKLRDIKYPTWSDTTTAPCHIKPAGADKRVLVPPPGTGFLLALFPEGRQVIPLYVLANVIIAAFALTGLWLARRPGAVGLAATFGTLAIYFMINPTKASYSMAPTMVVCALAGFLTARLFASEGKPGIALTAIVGLLLGLAVSFRLANVLLSAGYFLSFGLSFLTRRSLDSFVQGLSFGLGFLVGMPPVLAAHAINAGSPFATTYGAVDTVPPSLDPVVLAPTSWTPSFRWLWRCASERRCSGVLSVNRA